jgi:hypothetical protein
MNKYKIQYRNNHRCCCVTVRGLTRMAEKPKESIAKRSYATNEGESDVISLI